MRRGFIKLMTISKMVWGFFCGKIKQDFWGFVNVLILVVSIFAIYEQLRIQSQSNVVQTLNSISDKWDSEQMMIARSNVSRQWIKFHSDSSKVINSDSLFNLFSDGRNAQMIMLFMEHVGLYYKIGAVTREDIWEIKSWEIENYYNIFENYIRNIRLRYNDKNFYTNFEILYKGMQIENKKQGSPFAPRTIDGLREFCTGEIELINN